MPVVLSEALQRSAISRCLEAGETLFEMGDEGDGCYRLHKGCLKVILTSAQAGQRIIAVLGPGSIVGDLSMIDGQPRSASVVALIPCVLSFFSRQVFENFTQTHPELFRDLVQVLAARLRESDEDHAAFAFLPMKSRVARALLELAQCVGKADGGEKVFLSRKVTQRDLAALAGVARESVNRILNEWERDGLLNKSAENYEIAKGRLKRKIHASQRELELE